MPSLPGQERIAGFSVTIEHDAQKLLGEERRFAAAQSIKDQLAALEQQVHLFASIDHLIFLKKARLQAILKNLKAHVRTYIAQLHMKRKQSKEDFEREGIHRQIQGFDELLKHIDQMHKSLLEVQKRTIHHTKHILRRA